MLRISKLLCALLVVLTIKPIFPQEPLRPEQAQNSFRLEPGYAIELVAAEPLVESPSILAWDEAGRLFVAENRGYPTGAPDGSPQGRIAFLQDTDNDGRMDKRTEFASGLMFPNGIQPWKNGLLVMDAPHLYWLADTNRDNHADVREIWFTGFATNQTTQLRACYPTFSPDGWIYISRGWSGGVVSSPKWTNLPPVDLKDGDFRFKPDGSKAEAIGGNSQFGLVIDDVGRRFLVSNRNPLMHAVAFPDWWRRMPKFEFSDVIQDVSPIGSAAKVHPLSEDYTTAGFITELMDAPHAGTFTSACGIHQHFGERLGPEMQGSWFICEPAQNLVQRQIAVPDGPTFRSKAVPVESDFLASSDPWFHPVSAWTGPDGALYIADMYRKFIDHPEYMPADVRPKIDFDSGKNMGRIWRIRSQLPSNVKNSDFSKIAKKSFNDYTTEDLIKALKSSNIWTRQTANRLLASLELTNTIIALAKELDATLPRFSKSTGNNGLETFLEGASQRASTEPAYGEHLGHARMLRFLFASVENLTDQAKALVAIESSPHKLDQLWLRATMAKEPSLREIAWLAYRNRSDRRNPVPDVAADLLRVWSDDPSPMVRFHLAYCLGHGGYEGMTEALVNIVRRDSENRWVRAIVLSGLKERLHGFIEAFFASNFRELTGAPIPPIGFDDSPGMVTFAEELARLAAANGQGVQILFARAVAPEAAGSAWQAALLRGLSQGMRSNRMTGPDTPPLYDYASRQANNAFTPTDFSNLVVRLQRTAINPERPLTQRTNIISFLGELDFPQTGNTLQQLLQPTQPKEVRLSAAKALGQFDSLEAGKILASRENWNSFTPSIREIVLNALLSRPRQTPALLNGIESGYIQRWAIPASRRKQLTNHRDPSIKARAETLLASHPNDDRQKIYDEFKPILNLSASRTNGQIVFKRVCASCHQHGGEGFNVGPDLTGLRNQPAEALLFHILVPDAEIYPGFQSYEVETKDGRNLSGLLAAETENSITLKRALGEQDTITRDQIVTLSASRTSLMPSELEKAMTRQELADLLAFLRGR